MDTKKVYLLSLAEELGCLGWEVTTISEDKIKLTNWSQVEELILEVPVGSPEEMAEFIAGNLSSFNPEEHVEEEYIRHWDSVSPEIRSIRLLLEDADRIMKLYTETVEVVKRWSDCWMADEWQTYELDDEMDWLAWSFGSSGSFPLAV